MSIFYDKYCLFKHTQGVQWVPEKSFFLVSGILYMDNELMWAQDFCFFKLNPGLWS